MRRGMDLCESGPEGKPAIGVMFVHLSQRKFTPQHGQSPEAKGIEAVAPRWKPPRENENVL